MGMPQGRPPSKIGGPMKNACLRRRLVLAERTGLEPATPGVTGRYSNQLNYHSRPVAEATGSREFYRSHC